MIISVSLIARKFHVKLQKDTHVDVVYDYMYILFEKNRLHYTQTGEKKKHQQSVWFHMEEVSNLIIIKRVVGSVKVTDMNYWPTVISIARMMLADEEIGGQEKDSILTLQPHNHIMRNIVPCDVVTTSHGIKIVPCDVVT